MEEETRHLLLSLLGPVLIVGFMYCFKIAASTVFMVLLTFLVLYSHPDQTALSWIILAAFSMGFLSDLALNFMSRQGITRRRRALRFYFDEVGTLQAAIFAGMLTVWLILATVSIWLYIEDRAPSAESWRGAGLALTGFAFGFLIGFFSEPTEALRPLLPFYRSTAGWLENRAWDGISVTFALIPVIFFNLVDKQ